MIVVTATIAILVVISAIWLRNRWIIGTFSSYRVYGRMASLYLYRKLGLWHIGTSQDGSDHIAETEGRTQVDRSQGTRYRNTLCQAGKNLFLVGIS